MRALLAAALLATAAPARPPLPPHGVLLMAHGGNADWDAEVEGLRARLDGETPVETALGMADPKTLQAALDRLEARGARRVVVVPLFVHSRSEVLDQARFVLGLSEKPSEVLREAAERMKSAHGAHAGHGARAGHAAHGAAPGGHGHHHMFSLERVKTDMPLVVTPALDGHPVVARVLAERAKALSKDAKSETVVLVAHGPVDPASVAAWEASLGRLAAKVRAAGGYKAAAFGMLRDDAAPPVRAAAVAGLRAKVAAGAKGGRALVVPVLIARGGIEHKLASDLKGLDYAWDGRTLMPHAEFEGWVRERVKSAVEKGF